MRLIAMGLTAACSLLYLMIGFRLVEVIEDDPSGQTAFGLVAGAAFAIGALIIARFDRKTLWVLGSVGLALVIWMYFAIAPDRVPEYEMWGILLRILQVPLLATLAYLAMTPANPEKTTTPAKKELQTQ